MKNKFKCSSLAADQRLLYARHHPHFLSAANGNKQCTKSPLFLVFPLYDNEASRMKAFYDELNFTQGNCSAGLFDGTIKILTTKIFCNIYAHVDRSSISIQLSNQRYGMQKLKK